MRCDLCGQSYLTTHSCPGPIPAVPEETIAPPAGFAFFYYLHEAWRIVLWDDAAIRRIKDDKRELPYGILIWVVTNTLAMVLTTLYVPARARQFSGLGGVITLGYVLLSGAVWGLIHMGIMHLIAKYFCAGDGKFIQVIRPLLLGSIVYVALLIPFLGPFIAGIAWVAVMVMVFQEVHDMEPLTSFLLSFGVGLALLLFQFFAFKGPF